MKNIFFYHFLLLLFLSTSNTYVFGQQTAINFTIEANYNHALKLFNSKAFKSAQKYFSKVSDNANNKTRLKENADYYEAMCAIRLDQKDADQKVLTFADTYPNSIKKNKAYYTVGNYYFANKKAPYALKWYSKVNPEALSLDNKKELNFKMGYAFIVTRNLDLAKSKFIPLINDPKYGNDSRYYFGYISYKQEDYEVAEKTLEEIADDEAYKSEVTYYLLDISFKAGRFEKSIDVGLKLLKNSKPKEVSEISKIIGESYFNLEKYEDAITYLRAYKGKKGKWNNTDYYQLGYAYFKQKDFKNAANNFNKIIDQKNNVSQKAYYNLGECYIYLDKKSEALNAFKSASEMSFDLKVKEDATLNYAKLSYEEGNPFKSVAEVLQDFLTSYPKSPSYDEINTLVVTSYLYQQDYQGALDYLKKKKSKQNQMLSYEVSYYRAIQLFNLNKHKEALPYFQEGKKASETAINLTALYWSAETNYRLGNYQVGLEEFINFKKTAPKTIEEYQLIDYNIGYSYFKLKAYEAAAVAFENFVETKQNDGVLNDDATIRMGDSFFATKAYQKSISAYKKIVDSYGASADYAQYQIAMSHGFLENNIDKINALESLLNNFELSNFRDDALFQLGNTHSIVKDNESAHLAYNKLIQNFPKSSYIARTLLRDGLLFYNDNENKKALKNYKEIVAK
ncbi:MAG: tetratricopeptide repeat protein, partial [Flavobacteriaceae bacterium]|nr:tetratricopeptide repeat protein [Flavobacteriaceae bacterium]